MCCIDKKILATKISANKRGYNFSISKRVMENILAQSVCAYTGLPFLLNKKKNGPDHRRSLERFDNEIGYVNGNVIPVIAEINCVKSHYNLEELVEKFLSYYQKIDSTTIELEKNIVLRDFHKEKVEKAKSDTIELMKEYTRYISSGNYNKKVAVTMFNRIQHCNSAVHGKSYESVKNISDKIKSMRKNLKDYEKKLEDYCVLIKSVYVYENLSFLQKQKLKYGLSIDATLTDLLVEVMYKEDK